VNNSLIFPILDEETRIAQLRIAKAISSMITERLSSRDDALWSDNESSRCRPVTEVWTISISPSQGQRVFHSTITKKGQIMRTSRQATKDEGFAAFIGMDWADQKHDVCLWAADSEKSESFVINHLPETLREWIQGLRERFGGGRVAICLEQSRGPLIHALMGYEFLVLYPINPRTLAKYRETFSLSRAKDDPTDAALALELLRKHRDKLRAWKPDDEQTRFMGRLVEDRRKAVNWRTRLSNQLQAALKDYFPQALELVGQELASALACDFLLKWPTLEGLQKVRPQTLRKFYYGHNCRRGDLIEKRLQLIAQAKALTSDLAIVESSVMKVQMLVRQLRSLLGDIEKYDQKLAEIFPQHPDAPIFESLPGAGAVLAPRLLSALGSDRSRYESAAELQQYVGIAPVTKRSGKSQTVHWRWGCPKFLRQSFHEFAGQSVCSSAWAGAYYQQQLSKGNSHHQALRSLAFKWIRIIYRCWQERTPYCEATYLQSLQKRGSSLFKSIAQTPQSAPQSACA
jgi:transposase